MPCLSTFPLFNIQSPSVLPIVLCKQTLHKHPFVLLSKQDLLENKRKSDVSTFSRFVLQSSAGLHEGEFDDFGECSEKELTTRWTSVGPDITEEQKEAISQLPPKISNRCKALLRRIICFSPESDSLSDILAAWVKAMKPRRADWLLVLKHIRRMGNPLFFKVLSIPACFMLQLCHFMLFSVFCANVFSVEAGTAYSAFCLFYSFHKTFLYARCDVQFLVDQARVERGLGEAQIHPVEADAQIHPLRLVSSNGLKQRKSAAPLTTGSPARSGHLRS